MHRTGHSLVVAAVAAALGVLASAPPANARGPHTTEYLGVEFGLVPVFARPPNSAVGYDAEASMGFLSTTRGPTFKWPYGFLTVGEFWAGIVAPPDSDRFFVLGGGVTGGVALYAGARGQHQVFIGSGAGVVYYNKGLHGGTWVLFALSPTVRYQYLTMEHAAVGFGLRALVSPSSETCRDRRNPSTGEIYNECGTPGPPWLLTLSFSVGWSTK